MSRINSAYKILNKQGTQKIISNLDILKILY